MLEMPLVKYFNVHPNPQLPKSGQFLMYQNVNHPANAPKRRVTFKRWSNTGILIEEFMGTLYPGNFWILLDSSGNTIPNADYPQDIPAS